MLWPTSDAILEPQHWGRSRVRRLFQANHRRIPQSQDHMPCWRWIESTGQCPHSSFHRAASTNKHQRRYHILGGGTANICKYHVLLNFKQVAPSEIKDWSAISLLHWKKLANSKDQASASINFPKLGFQQHQGSHLSHRQQLAVAMDADVSWVGVRRTVGPDGGFAHHAPPAGWSWRLEWALNQRSSLWSSKMAEKSEPNGHL